MTTYLFLAVMTGAPGDPTRPLQLRDEGYGQGDTSEDAAMARAAAGFRLSDGDYMAVDVEATPQTIDYLTISTGEPPMLIESKGGWRIGLGRVPGLPTPQTVTPSDDDEDDLGDLAAAMVADRPADDPGSAQASPGTPDDVIVPEGDRGRLVPRNAVAWSYVVGDDDPAQFTVLWLRDADNRWVVIGNSKTEALARLIAGTIRVDDVVVVEPSPSARI